MLGKSLVFLSLLTVALFTWVILGSLKQENCINSNSIRNIIIFEGSIKKKVFHCNDLKFTTEHYDYNDIKIIKAVNSISKYWFFTSKQTPLTFPIRKPKSDKFLESRVFDQMLYYNFFRSEPVSWVEKSYLMFLKKMFIGGASNPVKFSSYLTPCEGCQDQVIENVSAAPEEFHSSLSNYVADHLYYVYQSSPLKQKILFEYFIKKGDLTGSLKTINSLILNPSFQKLNLSSQIKTLITWMNFYSQQNHSSGEVKLNLSHELLPTLYEFQTQLPLSWEDFTSISQQKALLKINKSSYDIVYGWILNLNEKVSRNKQVYLFQCEYPQLKQAMQYLYSTAKLIYVKVCNIKQMLEVVQNLNQSKSGLQLSSSNLRYVEYNLSSLQIIKDKINENFLLKPQSLSSVLYWEDIVSDPNTNIRQPRAAIDGVVSFRN